VGPREKRLRKGRKIRIHMTEELKALEQGKVNIKDVLEEPEGYMKRATIYTVLNATPKLGPAGVKKVLQATDTWPHDRIGHLSLETRRDILKHLPPRVANTFRVKRDTMI
jgi:hypothetical protein